MATINTILTHHHPNSNSHITHIRNNLPTSKPLHPFPTNIVSIRKHCHCPVPRCLQKPSDHGDRDEEPQRKSSERLYASIRNEKIRRLLERIEDEFQIFRYVPVTLILQSLIKTQGALVLSSLIAFVAKHLEIVVKPTTEGGADIGIRLNFHWEAYDIPLGPNLSFYTAHQFSGKVLLRNGKVLINPLLQLEPLKKWQKMVETAMPMVGKIIPPSILRRDRNGVLLSLSLALLFMALSLILWKDTVV